MTEQLDSFYFDHDEMFVVPIEHLTASGLTPTFATMLAKRRETSAAWVACFNEAFRNYYRRAQQLFDLAPDNWFPPRPQNLCIVTKPKTTRPYFQVFPQASWLLYESDFEPVVGSPELATYLLFHAEREGLSSNIVSAFAHNLGYFLLRTTAEREQFHAQVARCTRPGAAALTSMTNVIKQVDRIYHPTLNPPPAELPEPCGRISAADLIVPLSLQPALKELGQTVKAAAQTVVTDYLALQAQGRPPAHAKDIAEWLSTEAPQLLLSLNGDVLWDPAAPQQTAAVTEALHPIGELPAKALKEDLTIIDQRSCDFLSALANPNALPQGDSFEQEGGVYIHEGRQLIVYDAAEPSLNRLAEATAPYHRWLLGARTIHEWGHLAVEAGMVGVAPGRRSEEKDARGDVTLLLGRLIAEAPGPLRELAAQEQAQLGAGDADPGEVWTRHLFMRLPDYQTNLLARHFLPQEELEAYVRVNVRNHAQDGVGPYQQLMRYAFEYQYLAFSGISDPQDYVLRSTWFQALFVAPGFVTIGRMQAIWRAVARVVEMQRVDESAFRPGTLRTDSLRSLA